jgi:hypothetical protein
MSRFNTLIIVTMASLSLALAACPNEEARVADGEYVVFEVHGHDGSDLADILAVELTVDRSSHSAVFTLQGGTQLSFDWTSRPKSQWIAGCHTNVNHTELEVLEIDDATLLIESMEFENPVLVATCGSGWVILTEADSLDAAAGPCDYSTDKCLSFQPKP